MWIETNVLDMAGNSTLYILWVKDWKSYESWRRSVTKRMVKKYLNSLMDSG